MLTCYFGVPGCGKTTLLTKFAVRELRRIQKGKSAYRHVYTNFFCAGCEALSFDDLANYKIKDSLILIDEITLDADNRNFKQFNNDTRDFFILHRHLCNDIIYATQSYDMVDLKIRRLTQELWYMSKSVVPFLSSFTTAKRIFRNININEHTSELVMGYRFCNFLEAIFTTNRKLVYRKKYYKYFDSYDEGALSDRPEFISAFWNNQNGYEALPHQNRLLKISKNLLSKAQLKKEDIIAHQEIIDSQVVNENFDYFYDEYIPDEDESDFA